MLGRLVLHSALVTNILPFIQAAKMTTGCKKRARKARYAHARDGLQSPTATNKPNTDAKPEASKPEVSEGHLENGICLTIVAVATPIISMWAITTWGWPCRGQTQHCRLSCRIAVVILHVRDG